MNTSILALLCVAVAVACMQQVEAGQGCPFDDGSCQEYCSQQGCNMGYCGHFAWIQCICRKCGDEWSWYDKVRYNPDKVVNQTELESLKLNGTTPLILTNVSTNDSKPSQPPQQQQQQQKENKPATLTTLLIPDLSDTGKLDLNDIPDEDSDKFLDYLAKNHEKLVQVTSATETSQPINKNNQNGGEDDEESETQGSTVAPGGENETAEIQISTAYSIHDRAQS